MKRMAIARLPYPQLIINNYGKAIETVDKFKYLGRYITTNKDPYYEVSSH